MGMMARAGADQQPGCGSPGADEDSIVATATDVEKILGPVDPVAVALKMYPLVN